MNWKVIYHPDVTGDLEGLGRSQAARIMRVIDERIRLGKPDKIGKPLYGSLAGYRRLRTGSMRIVYRVNVDKIEVLVVAVGMRRKLEVYAKAEKRSKQFQGKQFQAHRFSRMKSTRLPTGKTGTLMIS